MGKPPRDADDDPDDAALFRAAVGPVRPLPAAPSPPSRPRPRARARMAEHDEEAARGEFLRAMHEPLLEAGDALAWRRDEVPSRVLQRLRRGEYAVQDELDLHHADVRQAEALLREFLRQARDAGHGCVRIVHGKGLHSHEPFGRTGVPILKNLVDRLLRQRSDVLAFHSSPAQGGGTGAVLVLLAAGRR